MKPPHILASPHGQIVTFTHPTQGPKHMKFNVIHISATIVLLFHHILTNKHSIFTVLQYSQKSQDWTPIIMSLLFLHFIL